MKDLVVLSLKGVKSTVLSSGMPLSTLYFAGLCISSRPRHLRVFARVSFLIWSTFL